MGELQTNFGRHEEALEDLEALLRGCELPQHNALVVGAGLDNLPVFKWLPDSIKAEQPLWLQKQYSWEYLEVAAVLERLGKPWTITVVDSSAEVCEALKRQENAVIDDPYGQNEYAKRFLAAFGVKSYDEEDVKLINAALKKGNISNRVTIVKRLYISSVIRERIAIVNGSVQELGGLALPYESYDVITCFNVYQHIKYSDETCAMSALSRRLAKDGVIATDFNIHGLVEKKPHRLYELEEYGEMNRYVVYFLGKPQAAAARIPLGV